MVGTLYVVATPIGNLDDISARALEVLRSVTCIACEDTRRTARLASVFGIEARTISCHRFNERSRLERVLRVLREGRDVALVSDGGTPGVSDPGALLVRAALDGDIPVVPLPGPSAVASLLSVSGLSADRFVFDGFLPHRGGERRRRLRELRDEVRTVVLFEAPHRIHRTLRDVSEVMGDRRVVLGRELTKKFETILAGNAREIAAALAADEVKGEITLAIEGRDLSGNPQREEPERKRILEAWHRAVEQAGGNRREALRNAARDLGRKRSELYRLLAELGENGD